VVTVKALQICSSNGWELQQAGGWKVSYLHTTRIAARRAYEEAGITNPRRQISVTEVHDCFSITELVTMEDLLLSREGEGWRDVLDGNFDAEGPIPCQLDGGLKCFGHPIGASGLRMIYENYLQLLGRAGERQRRTTPPSLALSVIVGGMPNLNVSAVAIVGLSNA
jgi:acetyl-CoA C-acetyltransferase